MTVDKGDIKWHKLTGSRVVVIAESQHDDSLWKCRLEDNSVIEYYEHELQDANPNDVVKKQIEGIQATMDRHKKN
jgi:hypothetical protein